LIGANFSPFLAEFFSMMEIWFPMIYDIKVLMQSRNNNFGGGLNEFADFLQVVRIGPQHQAGSDSLLTALTFFELVKKHLPGLLEEGENECVGRVYGLNFNSQSIPKKG
jgi:CCR4-NOT transcription complex subunit 7/8